MIVTWVLLAIVALLLVAVLVATRVRDLHPSLPRASDRVSLAVPVRLRVDDRELDLVSIDVSRGGICLGGSVRASAGQPVELQLALPGQRAVAVHGVVRWVQRDKFGVLFDLQDRRRVSIGDWIAAQQAVAGE